MASVRPSARARPTAVTVPTKAMTTMGRSWRPSRGVVVPVAVLYVEEAQSGVDGGRRAALLRGRGGGRVREQDIVHCHGQLRPGGHGGRQNGGRPGVAQPDERGREGLSRRGGRRCGRLVALRASLNAEADLAVRPHQHLVKDDDPPCRERVPCGRDVGSGEDAERAPVVDQRLVVLADLAGQPPPRATGSVSQRSTTCSRVTRPSAETGHAVAGVGSADTRT